MAKVLAAITTSVDGYITGPDDGPSKGLGVGGERLHYWVFGAAAALVVGAAGGAKRVRAMTIDAGMGHSCALTKAGGVRCSGLDDEGQLGDGTRENRSVPVDVPGLGGGVTASQPARSTPAPSPALAA